MNQTYAMLQTQILNKARKIGLSLNNQQVAIELFDRLCENAQCTEDMSNAALSVAQAITMKSGLISRK